eukprot:jgi/Mesvir1/26783/Mv20552-RA.1
MFIAVRFLLEDPKKDQDEWIWEFGKVCSINKKRKIPHSILFVEHDGASKTYELALNDLPQDENSKEICAWVALDGVYPEDMTAYRVLKRSQAAVKAAASVDPTNMQDPVKKRQVEESAQQVPVKRAKGVVAGAAVQGSEAKAGTKKGAKGIARVVKGGQGKGKLINSHISQTDAVTTSTTHVAQALHACT